jgi:rod shape-determining protein MreD
LLNKIIRLVLLGFLTAFCQSILANLITIGGVAPDFAGIIILIIMLRTGHQLAYPAAFLVALVADVLNPELLGIGLVLRFVLAAALGELQRRLDLARVATRLYLLLGMTTLFQLLYQILIFRFDIVSLPAVYLYTSIPTLLYTALVGLIVILASDLSVNIEIGRQKRGGQAF